MPRDVERICLLSWIQLTILSITGLLHNTMIGKQTWSTVQGKGTQLDPFATFLYNQYWAAGKIIRVGDELRELLIQYLQLIHEKRSRRTVGVSTEVERQSTLHRISQHVHLSGTTHSGKTVVSFVRLMIDQSCKRELHPFTSSMTSRAGRPGLH